VRARLDLEAIEVLVVPDDNSEPVTIALGLGAALTLADQIFERAVDLDTALREIRGEANVRRFRSGVGAMTRKHPGPGTAPPPWRLIPQSVVASRPPPEREDERNPEFCVRCFAMLSVVARQCSTCGLSLRRGERP
jgi:ribosomal protein L40E